MTAKEYLEQVRHKQAEIGNLKRDKEAVKDMLFSLGGGGECERVVILMMLLRKHKKREL
ncbi:hypothetical protein [Blautia sp. MSJ-9]|uniref:hypothetical protein n=1 Tax=Blautia sp. MSJ-9 TaxID=2841511 RepID=UPI001C111B9F|nr:hypothetical protein [Blautia sp. MSJ-9]MBU5680060.1 hypothetical protein [Blautia sp. MSJ-9]